jgi:hypothetical protein
MQEYVFAVDFDDARMAVSALVGCGVANGQPVRVEPQRAARPGRGDPSGLDLTPQFSSPCGLFFARVTAKNGSEFSETA